MNNKLILQDKLKKLSSLIMKAKIEGKSSLKLQSEFYKLSKQYKAIWLKENKGVLI